LILQWNKNAENLFAESQFENFKGETIMTIKMDARSLVVGAAVAVVVLTSMGVARRDRSTAGDTDKTDALIGRLNAVELFNKLSRPQTDRFEVELTEVYTVILDTATGQAWRYNLSTSRETQICPAKIKPAGD
jgi:hypothetical protein